MRFEVKVIIISLVISFLFMGSFTYVSSLGQKTYYLYQVGIYKEEKNKNSKLKELKEAGYEGYVYKKENQFYVLSMISEDYNEIKEHSQKVKGIIKEYTVDKVLTHEELLELLAHGEEDD